MNSLPIIYDWLTQTPLVAAILFVGCFVGWAIIAVTLHTHFYDYKY